MDRVKCHLEILEKLWGLFKDEQGHIVQSVIGRPLVSPQYHLDSVGDKQNYQLKVNFLNSSSAADVFAGKTELVNFIKSTLFVERYENTVFVPAYTKLAGSDVIDDALKPLRVVVENAEENHRLNLASMVNAKNRIILIMDWINNQRNKWFDVKLDRAMNLENDFENISKKIVTMYDLLKQLTDIIQNKCLLSKASKFQEATLTDTFRTISYYTGMLDVFVNTEVVQVIKNIREDVQLYYALKEYQCRVCNTFDCLLKSLNWWGNFISLEE